MTNDFDISETTDYLFISIWPTKQQAPLLREMGIKLILSLYLRRPDSVLRSPPMTVLWMPFSDSPITPTPMAIFYRGVQAALPVIDGGGKVLVHCRWGIHRSPAMACCILIAQGYNVNEAIELVKRQRPFAKPDDGYVLARIKKFERDWNRRVRKTSSIDTA